MRPTRPTRRHRSRRLADAPELLDGNLDDFDALAGNLRDLRRINRWLGGVALSRQGLEALAADPAEAGRTVTLLDVGTGGADIPMALMADWQRRGRRLDVTAIDARAEVIEAARRTRPAIDRLPGLRLEVADGRSLPYADATFDVAHASLVLHHLEPAEATALLREMARVARIGIVVNDLHRGRWQWAGAWLLGHALTTNRYTRHDAPLSVRRAYSPSEAIGLLAAAGLRPLAELRAPFGTRWAMAAVPA